MDHYKPSSESSDRHQFDADHMAEITKELIIEIYYRSSPIQALSVGLRKQLESLPRHVRKQLVDTTTDGSTPLTLACKEGNIEVVEYLLTVCDADIERKGRNFWLEFGHGWDLTTPLGCAIGSQSLPVVECLVKLGAQVNVIWDYGFTPLIMACHIANLEIAKFLMENGADLKQRTPENETCLIMSVKSAPLCKHLIHKGVDVNARGMNGRNALCNAINAHYLETAYLLLNHGADPFDEDSDGTDALRMACFAGEIKLAEHLMNRFSYTIERMADTHELNGAVSFSYTSEMLVTMKHWRIAHQLRCSEGDYIQKKPMIQPRSIFGDKVEFTSSSELDEIFGDEDLMRIQSFIIHERQLGIDHKFTMRMLEREAISYEIDQNFDTAINLLLPVMKEHIQRDSILDRESFNKALHIVLLMISSFHMNVDLHDSHEVYIPQFKHVLTVLEILLSETIKTRHLLDIHPVHRKQAKRYDSTVQCLACLVYILYHTAETENDFDLLRSAVKDLIEKDVRTVSNQTLLHLCVSKLNEFFSNDDTTKDIFPSVEMTMLLYECGANINAYDDQKSTPLHIASLPSNHDNEVIRALIECGAHLDLPNKSGETAWDLMKRNPTNDIVLDDHISLQCTCANEIVRHSIPYRNILPQTLANFVGAHEP